MTASIAIVGRTNVGKSTLFNQLSNSLEALVLDTEGMTRDRQYHLIRHGEQYFNIIDTGGLVDHPNDQISNLAQQQSWHAIEEALALIWVTDGANGLTSTDHELHQKFRKLNKPILLAINKLEGQTTGWSTHDKQSKALEFHALGFDRFYPISAKRGDGVKTLVNSIVELLPQQSPPKPSEEATTLTLLGKPNVGKSTLTNHILGTNRMIISEQAGTTRDSVRIPFQRNGHDFILYDTAGVKRKNRTKHTIEKFSALKSLATITAADIVILIIDGEQGISTQDCHLLEVIHRQAKPIIVAINKCDKLNKEAKKHFKYNLESKLSFISYIETCYISAHHGTNINGLFRLIKKINLSLNQHITTAKLNKILQAAITQYPPPMISARRIKLRYAHLGDRNPFMVVIHGNQTDHVPNNYHRYLEKKFRETLGLVATNVMVKFKANTNPYDNRDHHA